MVKRVSLLGLGVALCVITSGCATSAHGIAAGQGTLGTGYFNKPAEQRLVQMIESGEADRLVADGKASKKTYVKGGQGDGSVLVTEYWIQGMLYRVDVHPHVNVMMDVLTTNVRRVEYGPMDRTLAVDEPIEKASIKRTLSNNSYAGQGMVAYVGYVGSDGTVNPVREVPGEVPDWSDRNGIDLTVRVDNWRSGGYMHFRGCRPPGVDNHGRLYAPDGRWVIETEGPATTITKYFYNLDMHKLMKSIATSQLYDTDILLMP